MECEQRRYQWCVVVTLRMENNSLPFAYTMKKNVKICTVLIIFIPPSPYYNRSLMRSLQDFAVPQPGTIFVDADTLPAFFDTNLVEPSRVVKVFRGDPQANIRVFYYQYLKLCFEVTDCDYEQYIRKIEDIINDPNFAFVFEDGEDTSVFNDLQFKQLIMEFFGLLGEGVASIEVCLNTYPIIDTVFIYFFRSILILTNTTDSLDSYIDRTTLFNILTDHFNVQMDVHDNCIRFPQSDIFVYEDRPDEVFMAFIDVDGENLVAPSKEYVSYEGSEEVIAPPIQLKPAEFKVQPAPQVQNLISAKPESHRQQREGKNVIKESYVSDEFLDYTSNSPALHTLVKENKLKESGTIDETKYAAKDAPVSFQEVKPKPSEFKPKEEPIVKTDPPQYVIAKSEYQSDYSSKSQFNDKPANNNDILNNLLAKQQPYSTTNAWQPPVDPGYGSKVAPSYTQPNNFAPQPSFNPSIVTPMPSPYGIQQVQPSYTQPNTYNGFNGVNSFSGSNVGINYAASIQKPGSSFNEPVITSKVQQKKPASYNPPPQQQPYPVNKPGFYDPMLNAPSPPVPPYPQAKPGKNPCGLNVSEEFTNSFTMKIMNEPHRSNVIGIRQKARNFRNSLKTYLK